MSARPFSEADLPSHVAKALWRADALGQHDAPVWSSGHTLLDAQLPGGGWPGQGLTEVLQPPAMHAEWRLLAPVLRLGASKGLTTLLINPPHEPHAVGLSQMGLSSHQWLRVRAHSAGEAAWVIEQVLKAGASTSVLAWLPHIHAAGLRRLQTCAARHAGPVFLFRPDSVEQHASAAPLRLSLQVDALTQALQVRLIKRRGPIQAEALTLSAWPAGLHALIERPLLHAPGTLSAPSSKTGHVALGRLDSRLAAGQPIVIA